MSAMTTPDTPHIRRESVGPDVCHITRKRRVELVKWKTGTDEYDLVSGILIRREAGKFTLATDDGPIEYSRAEWLLCEADDEEQAA